MEINAKNIKLIAMDLDGTLTQHKEALLPSHRAVLDRLAERYRLLMVGAGQVRRIFGQLGNYPIGLYRVGISRNSIRCRKRSAWNG